MVQFNNNNAFGFFSVCVFCLMFFLTVGCQENGSGNDSGNNGPGTDTPTNGGNINNDDTTVSTSSVSLSWMPPTTRTDGSTLSKIGGYRLHYGTSQGNYTKSINIDPGITEYVVENLPSNTYYFVITAYDDQGIESDFSNVVSKTI